MPVQYLGFVGTALVVLAYIPQVGHLWRSRCVAGVSLWAYFVWAVSAVLLLAYAIMLKDAVFILLQVYQLLATVSVLVLSLRRGVGMCDLHCGVPEAQSLSS